MMRLCYRPVIMNDGVKYGFIYAIIIIAAHQESDANAAPGS